MAFTQSYTYVTGVLPATSNEANEDTAKASINQETYTADYASNAFDYDSIQRGELNPIVNKHQFTTGEVCGLFTDNPVTDRAYFTSETKANSQTASVQYQDLFNTGDRIRLEYPGAVFITFGAAFACSDNNPATVGPGNGGWDSTIMLRYTVEATNTTTFIAGTTSYTYEETGTGSWTNSPGAGGSPARRWTGWQWMIEGLSAGYYQFCVVINPRVEEGCVAERQFTIETFYV
jgi:hypothetical protein